MPLETVPFDAAKYLGDPEAQAEFLAEAFASGIPAFIDKALLTVLRARGIKPDDRGMSETAGQALGEASA